MEELVADKIYRPIKVLLTLCLEAKEDPLTLSHLKMDFNATKDDKLGGLNLLDLVVQYRLPRLMPLFLSMNVSASSALRIAVTNGDDNAVELLLRHGVRVGVKEAEETAISLGYTRIAARLHRTGSEYKNERENESKSDIKNEFAPAYDESEHGLSEGRGIKAPNEKGEEEDGGYSSRSVQMSLKQPDLCILFSVSLFLAAR